MLQTWCKAKLPLRRTLQRFDQYSAKFFFNKLIFQTKIHLQDIFCSGCYFKPIVNS